MNRKFVYVYEADYVVLIEKQRELCEELQCGPTLEAEVPDPLGGDETAIARKLVLRSFVQRHREAFDEWRQKYEAAIDRLAELEADYESIRSNEQ